MKKIAILGLTANPPHIGHLEIIKQCASSFDEVWINVAYDNPFKKNLNVPYEDRLFMTQLMLSNAGIHNAPIVELDKKQYQKTNTLPVYTYEVMESLLEMKNDNKYTLIFGKDNMESVKKFKNYDYLESHFDIEFLSTDQVYHSTEIREKVSQGENVSQWVGEKVYAFIKNKGLYKTTENN